MMTESNNERQKPATQNQWGEQPSDNYGYASDEERRAKRGLEDWEMVEQMSETESSLKTWGISFSSPIVTVRMGVPSTTFRVPVHCTVPVIQVKSAILPLF